MAPKKLRRTASSSTITEGTDLRRFLEFQGTKDGKQQALAKISNCECRESQASSAGCRLWLPRALGKLSLFCFTTGRQLVIGCNSTDYALWITIESNNNPGLIMLMKPSFTSSNMIDSSGRWGRISSEPRKTFSKYLGHCVHYGWIYVPHLGCNDTAFSTWFYFHTFWVYTFQQASAWFLSDDPFSEFAASGKTRSTSHLLGEFVWEVYFMVFSSMTQPRYIQDFCTDWIDSVTSEMWAKVFSQYSTCQSFKKRFRWLLRPVKTEGFFIQSSWNLTIISRLGSEW